MTTGAVVVAAGIGRRMGTEINKVLLPLLDRPILAYSLETLQASPRVDRIAVVTREEDLIRSGPVWNASRAMPRTTS